MSTTLQRFLLRASTVRYADIQETEAKPNLPENPASYPDGFGVTEATHWAEEKLLCDPLPNGYVQGKYQEGFLYFVLPELYPQEITEIILVAIDACGNAYRSEPLHGSWQESSGSFLHTLEN